MALNEGQQSAVQVDGHCLIVACPGSGKTHTLVERAKRLLTANPSTRLCMVTFTKAAADEMRHRVTRAVAGLAPRCVDAGTFHRLAMDQFEAANRGKLPFTIASEAQSWILKTKAWQHAMHKTKTYIQREELLQALAYMKANRGLMPSDVDQTLVRIAMEHYQHSLHAQSMLDFDDVIEFALQGMQSGQLAPLQVTHLLVDEAQDVDQIQMDWILEHANRGVVVTCVGDDDQSIYQFRNALGYNGMMRFAERTKAKRITLDVTYRCPPAVVAHAKALIMKNPQRVPKDIRSIETAHGSVERRDFPSLDHEVSAIVMAAQAVAAAPEPRTHTLAVLTRTRGLLRRIETELLGANIPYAGGVEGSIWSGGVPGLMRGLIAALAVRDIQGATMPMAACGMGHKAITAARETLRMAKGDLAALTKSQRWLTDASSEEHDETIWQALRIRYDHLRALADARPASVIHAAAQIVELSGEVIANHKFLNLVTDILVGMKGTLLEIHRSLDAQCRLAATSDEDDASKAVFLHTLHGAKGLEFDTVWMAVMRDGVLPHAQSDTAEERRLCYVGMTRAKQSLIMSYSPGRQTQESCFLAECGLSKRLA